MNASNTIAPPRRLATLGTLALAGLLMTQPGASCVSSSGSGSDTRTTDGINGDATAPRAANVVASGRGPIRFTADDSGRFWVEDTKDDRTVVSDREVRRGDAIVVTPDENRVEINGRDLKVGDLKRDHSHRILFLADRSDRRSPQDDRRPTRDLGETDIPSGSTLLDSGKGTLRGTVRDDGTLYVYDADAKRVVASVRVSDGDRVTLSPGDDELQINGRRATNRSFSDRTNYRLYTHR